MQLGTHSTIRIEILAKIIKCSFPNKSDQVVKSSKNS